MRKSPIVYLYMQTLFTSLTLWCLKNNPESWRRMTGCTWPAPPVCPCGLSWAVHSSPTHRGLAPDGLLRPQGSGLGGLGQDWEDPSRARSVVGGGERRGRGGQHWGRCRLPAFSVGARAPGSVPGTWPGAGGHQAEAVGHGAGGGCPRAAQSTGQGQAGDPPGLCWPGSHQAPRSQAAPSLVPPRKWWRLTTDPSM